MIHRIAVIGAGNGGKAAAVDLALQGKNVRLFEFPEFNSNLDAVRQSRSLTAAGALTGRGVLDRVTDDLAQAVEDADMIMVCTQALAHERVARALMPFIKPSQLLMLNPGSTGGTLHFAHVFRRLGMGCLPPMVETSTLTYGCRATGDRVEIAVKVARVVYAVFPGDALNRFAPDLEALYSGLIRSPNVITAGLHNGNPVIHPAVTILNGARIENEGAATYFYRDGVSKTVAHLIQKVDGERMALLGALGVEAQPEPVTSVQQGYADSTDYYECYKKGSGFSNFRNPDTLDNRYLHEDIGMGLVMFCSLGRFLDVPTPTCQAIVAMGEAVSGVPYAAQGKRTLERFGLAGFTREALEAYLQTGQMPTGEVAAKGGGS